MVIERAHRHGHRPCRGCKVVLAALLLVVVTLLSTQAHAIREEQVFEVMGDARVGAVLGSGLDHDGAEDLRLGMVFIEPHRQAVGEREGGQRRALGKEALNKKKEEEGEIQLYH